MVISQTNNCLLPLYISTNLGNVHTIYAYMVLQILIGSLQSPLCFIPRWVGASGKRFSKSPKIICTFLIHVVIAFMLRLPNFCTKLLLKGWCQIVQTLIVMLFEFRLENQALFVLFFNLPTYPVEKLLLELYLSCINKTVRVIYWYIVMYIHC